VKQPPVHHPFNIEAPSYYALVVDDPLSRAIHSWGCPANPLLVLTTGQEGGGAPSHHYLSSLNHKPESSLSIEVMTLLLPLLEGLGFRV
jgi:hypothetical protein